MQQEPKAQDEAIAFLSDPASYGESGPVERIDTHASHLFLAGGHAYKLKRAVRFSYLDYSTVAQREQACRRELEVNRPLAPALYLAVRGIHRAGADRLVFDGEGAAIDWVLEMRRFDQRCLFDRMAEEGRLTPDLMRATADTIADFHAAATPAPEQGGAARWDALLEGNRRNLLARPGLDAQGVSNFSARLRARLEDLRGLLETRRRAGKVRRCHGDLHLRNICLIEGRPTLFDAIEFSDEIASGDLLYDLAFLLMDLQHRSLAELASLLFNRYFDRADESDGLACLPFFMSVRAAIRAHVMLAAASADLSGGAARMCEEARSYFALAGTLLQAGKPRLIAIGGLSGSGKSTLAAALASRFLPAPGARVIRSDVLRKRLFGVAPERRLGPEAYAQSVSDRVYAEMREAATRALAGGYSAILDATYMDARERLLAEQLALQAGVAFSGLWLDVDAKLLAQRVAARRSDASDATPAVVESQLTADLGQIGWTRIEAGGADTLQRAAAALV